MQEGVGLTWKSCGDGLGTISKEQTQLEWKTQRPKRGDHEPQSAEHRVHKANSAKPNLSRQMIIASFINVDVEIAIHATVHEPLPRVEQGKDLSRTKFSLWL